MERLTPKNYKGINLMGSWIPPTIKNAMWNKLGKLEDLEEQIGCPLEVRCNLYDGAEIFTKNNGKWIVDKIDKYSFHAYNSEDSYFMETFNFFNHKLTWWLKADRSE